jgi:enamine deaminase RidA (YjgF/YER057c/UK114 family)
VTIKLSRSALVAFLFTAIAISVNLYAQNSASAEARLKEKNIILPPVPTPLGNASSTVMPLAGAVRVGNLRFVSGFTSREFEPKGKVGKDLSMEQGYAAARHAGLIVLANVRAQLGSLDRVKRVVKVVGMVNAIEGFGDQPRVINGFSELIIEVFGESVGRHARSAIGMGSLPGNAPVEIEVVLEVK